MALKFSANLGLSLKETLKRKPSTVEFISSALDQPSREKGSGNDNRPEPWDF